MQKLLCKTETLLSQKCTSRQYQPRTVPYSRDYSSLLSPPIQSESFTLSEDNKTQRYRPLSKQHPQISQMEESSTFLPTVPFQLEFPGKDLTYSIGIIIGDIDNVSKNHRQKKKLA